LILKITTGYESHFVGVIGIVAVWTCYPYYGRMADKLLWRAAPFAFFLYAFHEPFMDILFGGVMGSIVPSPIPTGLAVVGAPLLTVVIALGVGAVLKRHGPRVYGLLTGGR